MYDNFVLRAQQNGIGRCLYTNTDTVIHTFLIYFEEQIVVSTDTCNERNRSIATINESLIQINNEMDRVIA